MSNISRLNEYRVCFADNTSETFMAESARSALNVLETSERPVAQLSRLKVGVGVERPVRNVRFTVAVTPEPAMENGCLAVPSVWVVPEETRVIFTAIPAPGYQFDGWYFLGSAEIISSEMVAEITVPFPTDPAALATEFEARFSVIIGQ